MNLGKIVAALIDCRDVPAVEAPIKYVDGYYAVLGVLKKRLRDESASRVSAGPLKP
jgi:hypothetical protein